MPARHETREVRGRIACVRGRSDAGPESAALRAPPPQRRRRRQWPCAGARSERCGPIRPFARRSRRGASRSRRARATRARASRERAGRSARPRGRAPRCCRRPASRSRWHRGHRRRGRGSADRSRARLDAHAGEQDASTASAARSGGAGVGTAKLVRWFDSRAPPAIAVAPSLPSDAALSSTRSNPVSAIVLPAHSIGLPPCSLQCGPVSPRDLEVGGGRRDDSERRSVRSRQE